MKREVEVGGVVTTTLYVGGAYELEVESEIETTYYTFGAKRVAMRVTDGMSSTVTYLHSDHLGSTSLTTGADGQLRARVLYYPYGEERYREGTLQTDFTYTGQRVDSYIDMIHMGARWYDPRLARWASADTIVPEPGNPQSLNRYSYVYNRPLALVDASGHAGLPPWWVIAAIGCAGAAAIIVADIATTPAIDDEALRATPPTDTDMTSWLLDQMQTNMESDAVRLIRESWQFSGRFDEQVANKAAALKAWVALVRTDAIWDFKVDIWRNRDALFIAGTHDIILGGEQLNYDAVANLHFGFVGSAAGFEPELLKWGAGVAQAARFADTKNPADWGDCTGSYCDHPYATYFIEFGIYLYGLYENGLVLNEATFAQALDDFIAKHGQPPAPPPGALVYCD